MSAKSYLLTGGDNRQLLPALRRATEIEITVPFIHATCLELVFGDEEAGIDE